MALTTIGMALRFADKLESRLEAVYCQLIELDDDTQTKEQAQSLISATNKRKSILKRLYDDNVYSDMDTGVLAPITSMQEDDYALSTSLTCITNDNNLRQSIAVAEKKIKQFYTDFGDRLRSGPRPILRHVEKMGEEINKIHHIG